MNNIKLSRGILLGTALVWLLAACGGGGGDEAATDSSGTYTGLTTQAQIDADNAETIATSAYENSAAMGTADFIPLAATGGSPPYALALGRVVTNFLDQAEILPGSTDGRLKVAVSDTYTAHGTCGGTATYNGFDEATGSFSMTVVFDDYCTNGNGSTSGTVVDGTMTLAGSVDEAAQTLQASATFSNLAVTLLNTGMATTTSGTLTLAVDAAATSTMNINMTIRDDTTGKTYKVENLTVSLFDVTASSVYFNMAGRFFGPDYGYCDLTTVEDFYLVLGDNAPSDGILLVSGANGIAGGSTKARLTIIDQYTYRVEADTNGNGTYNYDSGPKSW